MNLISEFLVETEYQSLLRRRLNAAQNRYKGLEEYMEVPDMDLWLNLKKEILLKAEYFSYIDSRINEEEYEEYEEYKECNYYDTDEEYLESLKDKLTDNSHFDRYDDRYDDW